MTGDGVHKKLCVCRECLRAQSCAEGWLCYEQRIRDAAALAELQTETPESIIGALFTERSFEHFLHTSWAPQVGSMITVLGWLQCVFENPSTIKFEYDKPPNRQDLERVANILKEGGFDLT